VSVTPAATPGRAADAARPGRTGKSSLRPPRPGRSRTARRNRWTVIAMVGPVVLGLLIFFVYPLIASVWFSLTRYDLVTPPEWNNFRNYIYLFTQDPLVGTAALNTLWFVVILVPIRMLTSLGVAGLLVRAQRASGVWRTIFYLPSLVPPVASVVAFVFLFNPGTGPVNEILGWFGIQGPLWFNDPAWSKPSLVILGVWVMGDIMIIFLASLLDVPTEQYEAASLDGANGLQKMRYVTFPSIVPVLLFALITGIIAALQYFTEASVASQVASGKASVGEGVGGTLGYPDNSLLTYTQWLYERGFGEFQLGYASALAVILFVVAALFLVILLRRVSAFNPEGAR
jgi:multiple sugar transport system permease protein